MPKKKNDRKWMWTFMNVIHTLESSLQFSDYLLASDVLTIWNTHIQENKSQLVVGPVKEDGWTIMVDYYFVFVA